MQIWKLVCPTVVLVSLCGSLSGCLKTRAQLREDQQGTGNPETLQSVPAQPAQEVEPQGGYAIEELKSEMTRLLGRVEDLERSQKGLTGKDGLVDKEDLRKLEARLGQLEQSLTEVSAHLAQVQEVTAQQNPEELFKKAKVQYDAENYEGAAELFGSYTKIPKVKHIQDALFYRGECYFKLKYYKKAIVEYSKFPEKYSHSTHMPEVLYKIALSFENLGMKEDAKGFFQELAEKYPKSPEAKKLHKKHK